MIVSERKYERFFWLASVGVALALAGCASMMGQKGVQVTLSGASEVPPVKTSATGTGTIVVGTDQSVSGSVTTSGVVGTAAHIHTGAAGANGPIAVGMDRNGDNGWRIPAGARFTDAQYEDYRAGRTYVNVHSAANKGGEIRGQLRP